VSWLEPDPAHKSYGVGATEVLDGRDADVSVVAGTVVAILGPSGLDKSTHFTTEGSPEEPASGEVLMDGASGSLDWSRSR
jgi:putative ABC transport system ATP-binding protein